MGNYYLFLFLVIIFSIAQFIQVTGIRKKKGANQTNKGIKKAKKGFCHAKANRDKQRCKQPVNQTKPPMKAPIKKTKQPSKAPVAPKVSYKGTITLDDPKGGLDYYPPAMPITGSWLSVP